jgi:hypothetical protein
MSSVSVGKMMGELFEKRLDAWQNAQRQGRRLEDHLLDTAIRRNSDNLPVFLPMGTHEDAEVASDTDSTAVDATPHRLQSLQIPAVPDRKSNARIDAEPSSTRGRRGARGVWLACFVVAGLVGGGVTLADRMMTGAAQKETTASLQSDAEKIATAIDTAQRSAHMRADSIATTPMLRAAITTDNATMHDLAEHEYVFPIGKRESIEVFQLRNGTMTSMLHLPAGTPAIETLDPQGTKLRASKGELEVVAAAPVASTNASMAGMIAVSAPVDASLPKRSIIEHSTSAQLTGLGAPIAMVDAAPPAGATAIKVPVPTSNDLGVTLELVAYPKNAVTAARAWVVPVRYSSFGLAGLFLLVYVLGLRRRS